jgi:hypothetical protein
MSALTIKIPEPIIDPATIMVASVKPSERLNDLSSAIASRGVKIGSTMQLFFLKILISCWQM